MKRALFASQFSGKAMKYAGSAANRIPWSSWAPDLTANGMSDTLSDMKVTSREFQRDFTRVREAAAAGERVYVTSGDQEFVFQRVQPKTWRGALKGKVRIQGDLSSTDLEWEASR
jgi:hypothetical protein